MKKTYNVSLGGRIFHLEEDAEMKLQNYIRTLEKYYSQEEGGNEIMNDIEGRIAELLEAYMQTPNKEVITMTDVEQVIRIMGNPDDIIDDDHNDARKEKQNRKLYRDPDNRVIGGVAAGIAAYFDISIIAVRIIFLLLAFFYGFTLWVYIILWIAIPIARTSKQKLEMKGETINISNIEKNIRDNINEIKDNGKIQNCLQKIGRFVSEVLLSVGKAVLQIGSLLLKAVAGFILFVSVLFLAALVGSLFSMHMLPWDIQYSALTIFISGTSVVLLKIAALFFVFCPFTLLIWISFRYLLGIKTKNSFVPITLTILWIISIMSMVCIGVAQAMNFSEESKEVSTTSIQVSPEKCLVIKINDKYDKWRSNSIFDIKYTNDGAEILEMPLLTFEVCPNNNPEIAIVKKAHGSSGNNAHQNAMNSEFKWELRNDTLWIDNYFKTPHPWRKNQIDMKIRLPENQKIFIDTSVEAENYMNYWNGFQGGGKYYLVQEGGLSECR